MVLSAFRITVWVALKYLSEKSQVSSLVGSIVKPAAMTSILPKDWVRDSERHVLNFKLQFQLVGDGLHDVHVDTGKTGALFIFEGRELGVGPHNQGCLP